MSEKFIKISILGVVAVLLLFVGLLLYFTFFPIDTPVYAESNISIVVSQSCDKSDTCPNYDDLELLFPQPVFLYGDDHQAYDNFRDVCIENNFCNFFSGIGNDTVWLGVTELDNMHTITLVPSPILTHTSKLTADEQRDIHHQLRHNQQNYEKYYDKIKVVEKYIEDYDELIDSNNKELRKLSRDIDTLKQNIQFKEKEKRGLNANDDKLKTINDELSTLRNDIDSKLSVISALKSQITDYKHDIQNYDSDLLQLHDDLRYFSNAINENEIDLKPTPLNNTGSRSLHWNTYSFYVDPSCSYSSFYPQHLHQLLLVVNFIHNDCSDISYLDGIQLDFVQHLNTTDIPITESAQWQFQQWMKNTAKHLRSD